MTADADGMGDDVVVMMVAMVMVMMAAVMLATITVLTLMGIVITYADTWALIPRLEKGRD